jgi:hypothetical protein
MFTDELRLKLGLTLSRRTVIARIGERGAPLQHLQERTLVLARGTNHNVGHPGILVSGNRVARRADVAPANWPRASVDRTKQTPE